MSKQFWGVIVLVVIIFAGIFFLTGNKKANAPSSSSSSGGSSLTNHVEGKGKSGIKLVEYGDYECPYCGAAYPVIKQVVGDLSDQIFFQFRNFPLTQLHQNAFAGARAAEAASLQNKFWQMHDMLYDNQDPSGKSGWVASNDPLNKYFVDFAKQLGLNVDKFKTDYQSSQVNDAVNADLAEGKKLNIQGTPTFFIDGKKIELPYSQGASAVENIINAEIAKKAQH